MVLKVILIASSVQLLSVLCAAKHSSAGGKDMTDESTPSPDQAAGIENILRQLFPGRVMGGEVEQISADTFSKLFGSGRRKLQFQDENGKDTGIQYDFIPHVESESVPESASYTFFLRTGQPRLFLFDPNFDDFRGQKNSPRKPKVQSSFDADGVDEHESDSNTNGLNFDDDSEFTQIVNNLNTFTEEDRQSKTPNVQKLTIQNILSLLDDSEEDEEENEIDVDEFSTLNMRTGHIQLEDEDNDTTNTTSKITTVSAEVERNPESNKKLKTLKTSKQFSRQHSVDQSNPTVLETADISYQSINNVTASTSETSHQLKTLEVGNITENPSKTSSSVPEMDHIDETSGEVIFIDDINQEEHDTDNQINSTAHENNNTFQPEINNNKLNQNTFSKNDERSSFGEDSVEEQKEVLASEKDTIGLDFDDNSEFTQNLNDPNTFAEEDRQSKIPNVQKLTIMDISSLLDDSDEDVEYTTLKMMTGHRHLEDEEHDTANEIESTADDKNNTLQLDISNNTLNKETLNRKDEHMVELVIDNLKLMNGTMESVRENEVSSGSWLKAIPFLAYWAVNYIRSDPRFVAASSDENEEERAQAISDNIERAIEEFKEENNSGGFDTSIYDVSEGLGNSLQSEKTETLEDVRHKEPAESSLDRSVETVQSQNSVVLGTKPNPCNCKNGGECIPASKTCYCSHGFTGMKCEKPTREALVLGGLRDFQIHLDSELVGEVDNQRCSPPDFPTPVMAATGQTDRDTVVVCGGATLIGGRLAPMNRCHIWANSGSWSPPVLMSSSRAWSASVLTPTSQMVVLGGLDHNNVTLDSIEVIDIKTRKSTLLGLTLPSPLAGHCAVQLNSSHTFVAGGAVTGLAGFGESANFSNQAWILSEAGWTATGDLVQARSVHSCSTVLTREGEVEVLVVGGIGLSKVGTRMVLDSVEIYNAASGRWRKGDKLPYPVFGAGLLELAGQPMLIGGRYQVDDRLLQSDDIFIYQDSWRSSPLKMRSPRDQTVTVAAPAGC